MSKPNRKVRILLSYSHKDREIAQKIKEYLGRQEWIELLPSGDDIKPGQNWREIIENSMKTADIAVLLMSEDLKYESIFQRASTILPVRLENRPLPSDLSNYEPVDLFQAPSLAERFLTDALKAKAKALLAGDSSTDAPPPPKKKKDK
jgi:TIR domain-containing protein